MRRLPELIQAVLLDPWSDAPRAAVADALVDVDPDRARFIRLQLEATRHRRAGQWRGADLLAADDAAWDLLQRNAQWNIFFPGATHWGFGRGFPEAVTFDARRFVDEADALFRLAPVLDATLTNVGAAAAELADSPFLSRLRSLRVIGPTPVGALRSLAGSPFVSRLRVLELSYTGADRSVLDAICASPGLGALRYLGFTGNSSPNPCFAHRDEDGISAAVVEDPALRRELLDRWGEKAFLTFRPGDRFVTADRFDDGR